LLFIRNLSEHWAIILVLIVFLLLGYFHATWAPLFVKPDEEYHFAYIIHIRKTGSLPSARERIAYQGYQAPLYYLLISAVSLPIPLDDVERLYLPNPHFVSTIRGNLNLFVSCPSKAAEVVYLARFFSLAFGAILIISTYLIGLHFLPKEVALMGSAGVAFLPSFAFISTSASNDMAAAVFMTLSLLTATEILKKGFTVKLGFIFGLTAGMATLSKLVGITTFALIPFIVLMSPGQRRENIKGGMAALCGLLIPLPWFVRNFILFGDPFNLFGFSPKLHICIIDFLRTVVFIWKSFWLDFSPGRLLYGPPWIYWLYGLLSIMGALGLARAICCLLPECHLKKALVGIILLQFLFISFPHLLFSLGHFLGGGRYLFGVVGGIMLLLAWGMRRIFPHRYFPLIWNSSLALLAFYALLRVLVPGYNLAHGGTIALSAEPIGFLEDKFALVKYDYDKEVLSPGEELEVEIHWQLLRPVKENYSVFVQLIGQRGGMEWPVAQVDTYPCLGYYPTCRWKEGEVVRDRYILRLPEDPPPFEGDLRLIAGMYKFETMERLKAYQLKDGRKERLYQDAFTLGFIAYRGPEGDEGSSKANP
jgi:4-amino-4-deoxy-L-arabinose transferase-like glycosyltransferase